jgi:DNA-binding NarL/FixJ family response regulator
VSTIRLLLVDDEPAVLHGLRMWLALEPDLLVVGEAQDGALVRPLVERVRPDVVVMDLGLPGEGGIEVTNQLRTAAPGVAVVVLSVDDDIVTRIRAWLAGAAAFVSKRDADSTLVGVIRSVAGRCDGGRPAQTG